MPDVGLCSDLRRFNTSHSKSTFPADQTDAADFADSFICSHLVNLLNPPGIQIEKVFIDMLLEPCLASIGN